MRGYTKVRWRKDCTYDRGEKLGQGKRGRSGSARGGEKETCGKKSNSVLNFSNFKEKKSLTKGTGPGRG